jgi:hypothetical protein
VTVDLALGGGDPTPYDVDFERASDSRNDATFLFGISDSAAGIASYSPVNGWTAWEPGRVALAWSYEEGYGVGAAIVEAGVTDDDGEVDWDLLGELVAATIMGQ